MRSNAILNVENNDKNSFISSLLPHLYPCNNNHPNMVSNWKQYLFERNIEDFDFTNGFKCSGVHKIEKLIIYLSFNLN